MRVDHDFIIQWSQRYVTELPDWLRAEEEDLLGSVGPTVRGRGHYTQPEVERVNRWKLPTQRNRKRLAQNSAADIEAVTKRALAADEPLQLYILREHLHGVSDGVASGLLIFPFPDRHTVIDFRAARALEALHRDGQLADELLWRPPQPDSLSVPPYPLYLDACRRLARHVDVSLRDLDRALWQWHKETSGRSP